MVVMLPADSAFCLFFTFRYLKFVKVRGFSVFALFPIVLAIAVTWTFGAILTAADVWAEGNCVVQTRSGTFSMTVPGFDSLILASGDHSSLKVTPWFPCWVVCWRV